MHMHTRKKRRSERARAAASLLEHGFSQLHVYITLSLKTKSHPYTKAHQHTRTHTHTHAQGKENHLSERRLPRRFWSIVSIDVVHHTSIREKPDQRPLRRAGACHFTFKSSCVRDDGVRTGVFLKHVATVASSRVEIFEPSPKHDVYGGTRFHLLLCDEVVMASG